MKKLFLFMLICFIPALPLHSQSRKVRQAIKKQERQENYGDKNYEKQRDAALRHRYNIQTKEVQSRMKSSKKKADQFNRQKREPFYTKLFKRKKRKR